MYIAGTHESVCGPGRASSPFGGACLRPSISPPSVSCSKEVHHICCIWRVLRRLAPREQRDFYTRYSGSVAPARIWVGPRQQGSVGREAPSSSSPDQKDTGTEGSARLHICYYSTRSHTPCIRPEQVGVSLRHSLLCQKRGIDALHEFA